MDLLNVNDRSGQYPRSYYAASAKHLPLMASLQGNISCDVCVIGAGYTGLATALHLAERGYDVVVLEAQRVGFGASGRNGGQLGSGQRLDQGILEKQLGFDMAKKLWELAQESKKLVKDLIAKHEIDCGYGDGVMHAQWRKRNLHHDFSYVEKLNNEYGYGEISALDKNSISEMLGSNVYCGGSFDRGAGHLHPLNFVLGLARACLQAGVRIFEQTKAKGIRHGDPAKIITGNGHVLAKFVAIGTNGYLGDLEQKIASRVMPINNFILATEPLGKEMAKSLIRDNIAVADSRFVVNYFKLSQDYRLLFGGGESYGYKFPLNLQEKPRKPMLEIFPQLRDTKIDFAWGGTLAITMSRMPDFSRLAPNVFSASGYSGHGVGMAVLAGKLLCEVIGGTAERFDLMAKIPGKPFPGGIKMRLPLLILAMSWYSLRDRF